jgi:hypothetical protein
MPPPPLLLRGLTLIFETSKHCDSRVNQCPQKNFGIMQCFLYFLVLAVTAGGAASSHTVDVETMWNELQAHCEAGSCMLPSNSLLHLHSPLPAPFYTHTNIAHVMWDDCRCTCHRINNQVRPFAQQYR